jgi:enamine deaminase RidA (YjgF/YER057c/UK114 family)
MKREILLSGSQDAHNNTQAVKVGSLIFIGGQMSLDPSGRIIGETIESQARNVFESINDILTKVGANMSDVVKHNVYLDCSDEELLTVTQTLDRIRSEYFSQPGPVTTETRAHLPKKNALIQVEAIASTSNDKRPLMPPNHWSWPTTMPYVHGWKVGDVIFVGSQRSLDIKGNSLGDGDIATQTQNVFQNMEAVMKEAGGSRSNLLRQNTYYNFLGEGRDVTDYWENMTRVRLENMSNPCPCGTGVRVIGFPNAKELIQVEGIGVLGENKTRLMPNNHWDWSITKGPFSQGWEIGNFIFVGGQISADENGRAVGETLEIQTRNVFDFIHNTLHEAGADERDVVKVNSYYGTTKDNDHNREISEVVSEIYREYYPNSQPVYTEIGVTGFAFENLLIEIEAIAMRTY